MPYVLNTNRGTIVTHPTVGRIHYGVAIKIPKENVEMLKHIRGLFIFEKVEGIDTIKPSVKNKTELFGIDIENIQPEDEKKPIE